jgi:hypothetical protein
MNQDNFEYLKKNLTYLGFDEKDLLANLESKIRQDEKEFTLPITGEYKRGPSVEKVDYVLSFRKSDQKDMYFFNNFKATLLNENPSREVNRTFYLEKGSGVTAKEAFNLLSGRAVKKKFRDKDDKPYDAWVKINFMENDKYGNFMLKKFGDKFGFDLEKTLERFPILELKDPELKDRLINSLQRGNTAKVTFDRGGKDNQEGMYVEANPQYKTLNVYNADMKKIFQENVMRTEGTTTRARDQRHPEVLETKQGISSGSETNTASAQKENLSSKENDQTGTLNQPTEQTSSKAADQTNAASLSKETSGKTEEKNAVANETDTKKNNKRRGVHM